MTKESTYNTRRKNQLWAEKRVFLKQRRPRSAVAPSFVAGLTSAPGLLSGPVHSFSSLHSAPMSAPWHFMTVPCFCKILLLRTLLLLPGVPFTLFSVWKIPPHPSQPSSATTCTVNLPLTSSNLSSIRGLLQTNKQTNLVRSQKEADPFASLTAPGALIPSFKCFLEDLTVLDAAKQ